jgi:hypothetical protein
MFQLSQLLREIALVEFGFTPEQAAETVKARSLPKWADDKLGEQGKVRIGALSELAHWRNLSTDELNESIVAGQFGRYLTQAVQGWFEEGYQGAHRDLETKMNAELKESMTTAHFAQYFADAIDRRFYADYQYKAGDWRQYVFQDTVPDFRDVKRFRMTEPEGLVLRGEKQSGRNASIDDSYISYGVDEFARTFDVSWRTILNDDLGKIRETPVRMGNAARRWLDSFVSMAYDNATSQAALVALGAVYAGTGRLTLPNLAIGINAMMQRTDTAGNQMAINRVHLVIPPVLRVQAAAILKDLVSYGGPNSNVLSDFIASIQVDPYIGFSGADVPWYLFADPAEVPTVTLARLQGVPGAFIMQKTSDLRIVSGAVPAAFLMGDFGTGNIVYAVEDIAGIWDDPTYAGVTDYRGIYYSSGTTA